MKATLLVEDHANTDYSDIAPRKPYVSRLVCSCVAEAVKVARAIQADWRRGHHIITDIVANGVRLHVSQNGRVWSGLARDGVESVPVTVYG